MKQNAIISAAETRLCQEDGNITFKFLRTIYLCSRQQSEIWKVSRKKDEGMFSKAHATKKPTLIPSINIFPSLELRNLQP